MLSVPSENQTAGRNRTLPISGDTPAVLSSKLCDPDRGLRRVNVPRRQPSTARSRLLRYSDTFRYYYTIYGECLQPPLRIGNTLGVATRFKRCVRRK